jgi:hypothetical protein
VIDEEDLCLFQSKLESSSQSGKLVNLPVLCRKNYSRQGKIALASPRAKNFRIRNRGISRASTGSSSQPHGLGQLRRNCRPMDGLAGLVLNSSPVVVAILLLLVVVVVLMPWRLRVKR